MIKNNVYVACMLSCCSFAINTTLAMQLDPIPDKKQYPSSHITATLNCHLHTTLHYASCPPLHRVCSIDYQLTIDDGLNIPISAGMLSLEMYQQRAIDFLGKIANLVAPNELQAYLVTETQDNLTIVDASMPFKLLSMFTKVWRQTPKKPNPIDCVCFHFLDMAEENFFWGWIQTLHIYPRQFSRRLRQSNFLSQQILRQPTAINKISNKSFAQQTDSFTTEHVLITMLLERKIFARVILDILQQLISLNIPQ